MAPVLKTGIVSKNYRGFESLSLLRFPRQINRFYEKYLNFIKMVRLFYFFSRTILNYQ